MRILIDGCDGTGKTSTCEKLANKLGCNIVRLTYNGDRRLRSYAEMMTLDNVIHDRTFLSELIYPKYFGKISKISSNGKNALLNLIDEYDAKVFILTASFSTIVERLRKRGDEFINDVNILKKVNDEYINYAEYMGYTVIDTSSLSVDEVVDRIERNIKHERI